MNINFISYFGVQGLIAEGHGLGHVGSSKQLSLEASVEGGRKQLLEVGP